MQVSAFLDKKIAKHNATSSVQIVYVDIVSYSKRRSSRQTSVIEIFIKIFRDALRETAAHYKQYLERNRLNIERDVVMIFSGDGAAVAFPMEGLRDIHLQFAMALLSLISNHNMTFGCKKLTRNGWCDCHDGLTLRTGVSEGRVVLYRDLNHNYNVAGQAINLAVRVMDLADPNQIVLTEEAFKHLVDETDMNRDHFRKLPSVEIKHGVTIDAYQYINNESRGLNTSTPRRAGKRPRVPDGGVDLTIQRSRSTPFKITKLNPEDEAGGANAKHIRRLLLERLVVVRKGMTQTSSGSGDAILTHASRDIYVDKFPMTQNIYSVLMKNNPSHHLGTLMPVENVSWLDAIKCCNAMSKLFKLESTYSVHDDLVVSDITKNGFRLLSEREWMYVCVGDMSIDVLTRVSEVAWTAQNSGGEAHAVGQKHPNSRGVFDLLGNVWEWCGDWHGALSQQLETAQAEPSVGIERVLHGGSFLDQEENVSFQLRSRRSPRNSHRTVGFRIARNVE